MGTGMCWGLAGWVELDRRDTMGRVLGKGNSLMKVRRGRNDHAY